MACIRSCSRATDTDKGPSDAALDSRRAHPHRHRSRRPRVQHRPAAPPGRAGLEVIDHGPTNYDPLDDYPSFCINAAKAVVRDQQAGIEALGVVFGGSGNGEQMAANKVDRRPRRAGLEHRDRGARARAQRREPDLDRRPPALARRGDRVHRHVPRDAVLERGAPRAPHRPARRVRGDGRDRRPRDRLSRARGSFRPPDRAAVRPPLRRTSRSRCPRRRAGSPATPRSSTATRIVQSKAVGKQMFLEFDHDLWLRVHLGLYGAWDFAGDIGRRSAATGEASARRRSARRG